jgi:hypothetical protein
MSPSRVSAASRDAGMVWYLRVTADVEGVSTSRRAPSKGKVWAVFMMEMGRVRLKAESTSCFERRATGEVGETGENNRGTELLLELQVTSM